MLRQYTSKLLGVFSSNGVKRNMTTIRSDLCGRDMLQPNDFTLQEWKKILLTALDLKNIVAKNDKKTLNLLHNKHVTLLFIEHNGRNLLACSLASQILGARSTYCLDANFESQPNYVDCGRALSRITDIIVVNGCNQTVLNKIAEGSCVPVVGLSTNMFSIFKALTFLLTIQEKYGCLKQLKVAWIGPSSPLCNAVLSIFPSFGINIKFCCICAHGSGQMTPVIYENAIIGCSKGSSEIHQSATAVEAIYRVHVVIVSPHPEEENRVTLEMLEEAELDWMFLHTLPRGEIDVSDELFKHKNNFTWECSGNHLYVAMALITSFLKNYEPKISVPSLDGS